MNPLVLLVLLTFFFVVALAFTAWAALTLGDAAKRSARKDTQRQPPPPPREPKPWERTPPSEPVKRRRLGKAKSAPVAAQESLWERQPPTPTPPLLKREGAPVVKREGAPVAKREGAPVVKRESAPPVKAERRAQRTEQPAPPLTAAAEEERGSRAVVTPRQPNTDAFERFLESEKRRD